MMFRSLGIIGMLLLAGCGLSEKAPEEPAPVSSVEDAPAIENSNRSYPKTKVPGFSVDALEITVKGESVLLFEYPDIESTEAEMARISADGTVIGDAELEWFGPVHFFATGKQIAVYVGSNPETIRLLSQEGGEQFAGDSL